MVPQKKGMHGCVIALIVVAAIIVGFFFLGIIASLFSSKTQPASTTAAPTPASTTPALIGTLTPAPTAKSAKPTVAPTANASVQQGEGKIAKYYVKIKSAKVGKDLTNDPVIIVTYEWTNNSDSACSFSSTFSDKAYQDGIECEASYFTNGLKNGTSDIKPGKSVEVVLAYVLKDKTTPVDIEVSEWLSFSLSPEMVTETFTLK